MSLPPLRRVPALRRLLAPGEAIVYTALFYPLRGWYWLLPCALCLIGSRWWTPLMLPTVLFFVFWVVPFFTNQVAVTTERLLMRVGGFRLRLEMIDNGDIESWRLEQNVLTSLLRCGTVVISVNDVGTLRHVRLTWLWHPMSFLEALETLQVDLRRAAGIHDSESPRDAA